MDSLAAEMNWDVEHWGTGLVSPIESTEQPAWWSETSTWWWPEVTEIFYVESKEGEFGFV